MLIQKLAMMLLVVVMVGATHARGATHDFYGRSGNAIEIDFSKLPGVAANATFNSLSLGGFNGHTVLTSSELGQGSFSSDGRLWVFPNPARDSAAVGDTDEEERGFQGRLEGSVQINGQPMSFAVNVRPGYTGVGTGSVGQSGERINRPTNNPLYVAQQQHRLNYLGFVPQGGGQLSIDGNFGSSTDLAISTFQAAFIAGLNTTQASVDGIVGPNTASWLNAANAPTWDELIDPDPQVPGTFSVANMIGDFDILPSRDPGTGIRSGLTPQVERWGTNWAIELWRNGSEIAKAETGQTQLMNAMSTDDGYGSSFAHNTHRVGMDIDMHVDAATQNFGDGQLSRVERRLVSVATAYIDAGTNAGPDSGRIIRIISSNEDILDGIVAARPGTAVYFDTSGVHLSHLHLDVGAPAQVSGLADLPGDFDFDGQINAFDFLVWQRGSSLNPLSASDLSVWQNAYGANATVESSGAGVPEPSTGMAVFVSFSLTVSLRNGKRF